MPETERIEKPADDEFMCPRYKSYYDTETCEARVCGKGCSYMKDCKNYQKRKEKENEKN